MHFPMYTVTAERLLEMTKVCPHEELKARTVGANASLNEIAESRLSQLDELELNIKA